MPWHVRIQLLPKRGSDSMFIFIGENSVCSPGWERERVRVHSRIKVRRWHFFQLFSQVVSIVQHQLLPGLKYRVQLFAYSRSYEVYTESQELVVVTKVIFFRSLLTQALSESAWRSFHSWVILPKTGNRCCCRWCEGERFLDRLSETSGPFYCTDRHVRH